MSVKRAATGRSFRFPFRGDGADHFLVGVDARPAQAVDLEADYVFFGKELLEGGANSGQGLHALLDHFTHLLRVDLAVFRHGGFRGDFDDFGFPGILGGPGGAGGH